MLSSKEMIFRQGKDENRRLAGGKSRFTDAALAEKQPLIDVILE
jgi:hypothetical protein